VTLIELRDDLAANWTSVNPILGPGEVGLESDTGYSKVGNGTAAWASLPYTLPSPLLAVADSASAPTGVLSTPAGSGSATVIPTIPLFPANKTLPQYYVIQHSGVLYYKTTAGMTGASWNASLWTGIGSASASTPLLVNLTAVTTGGTLPTGEQTQCNAASGTLAMVLPTGAASGTFIVGQKTDSSANQVTITGTIPAVTSGTVSLVGMNETIGFVADSTGAWWIAWSHKPLSLTDARYGPQLTGLIVPAMGATIGESTANANMANTMLGRRYIMPKGGALHDVGVFVTSNEANLAIGVYDTGNASTGNRTLLASNSFTSVANGAWCTWDPALAVTEGQHLDIGVFPSATATLFMAENNPTAATYELPNTSFLPCVGGAAPKLWWISTALPAYGALTTEGPTLAEANLSGTAKCITFVGRVA
jgi:hypothetical protein